MTSPGRILIVDDEESIANEDVALARTTLADGAFDDVAKPFDFAHLDRTVSAGLLHAAPEGGAEAKGDAAATALALTVGVALGDLDDGGRASVERALAGVRHALAAG
jgi:hypothetical protein